MSQNNLDQHDQQLIFVIDDEESVCRMLQVYLERAGYTVRIMNSGKNALDMMGQEFPIAIISDIRMPDLDGLELLSQVMSYDPDMVVILMTGAPSLDITIEALRAGATDFLPKPIDMKFLLNSLNKGVERRRNRLRSKRREEHLEMVVGKRTKELTEAIAELKSMTGELALAYEGSVEMLRRASTLRDNDTGEHIDRIRLYSGALAKAIGMSADEVSLIMSASPMHDIGKIGIPDEILQCRGSLTHHQFEVMKKHTIIGHEILSGYNVPILSASAEIALTHHERWDGSGYPNGLVGEEIPIMGRIVAVVDVWDALTQPRCYKPAFEINKSLNIMEMQRPRFDPDIMKAFFEILPELKEISMNVKEKIV